jgi:hypothetical protein
MSLTLHGQFKFVLPNPGGPITFQIGLPFIGSIPVTVTPSEEVVIDPGPWPYITPFSKPSLAGVSQPNFYSYLVVPPSNIFVIRTSSMIVLLIHAMQSILE